MENFLYDAKKKIAGEKNIKLFLEKVGKTKSWHTLFTCFLENSSVNVLSRTTASFLGLFSKLFTENQLHLAVQREYPQAESLPIPANIDPNEAIRFSPLRNRDINASAISVHQETLGIDVTLEQTNEQKAEKLELHDIHLDSYDRSQPVNLSSIMQTFVPEPFSPPNDDLHRSSYLSFPGGNWGQQTKYLSHELNSNHYTELRQEMRADWSSYKGGNFINSLMPKICLLHPNSLSINHKRFISLNSVNFTNEKSQDEVKPIKESSKDKLKKAVKEYGSTVIVFHVGISLVSLGLFYTLVSR